MFGNSQSMWFHTDFHFQTSYLLLSEDFVLLCTLLQINYLLTPLSLFLLLSVTIHKKNLTVLNGLKNEFIFSPSFPHVAKLSSFISFKLSFFISLFSIKLRICVIIQKILYYISLLSAILFYILESITFHHLLIFSCTPVVYFPTLFWALQ